MKLTCPNCAAGFEVRAEALGPMGRKVRCSACRYQWLARAAADAAPVVVPVEATVAAAAPPPPPPPEPEPPAVDITPAALLEPEEPPDIGALREAAILRPSAPPLTAGPPHHDDDEAPPRTRVPPTRAEAQPPRHRGALLGWLLFALVLIGIGAVVVMRAEVMAAFPETRDIFRRIGFNVPGPTDGLLINNDVRLSWSRNQADGPMLLVVQGTLTNRSTEQREVPQLRGVLSDGQHREITSWTFTAGQTRIAGGETISFRSEVQPPPGAATAAVRFVVSE
jgi:predicted Zn finger-like uncharacterized protein